MRQINRTTLKLRLCWSQERACRCTVLVQLWRHMQLQRAGEVACAEVHSGAHYDIGQTCIHSYSLPLMHAWASKPLIRLVHSRLKTSTSADADTWPAWPLQLQPEGLAHNDVVPTPEQQTRPVRGSWIRANQPFLGGEWRHAGSRDSGPVARSLIRSRRECHSGRTHGDNTSGKCTVANDASLRFHFYSKITHAGGDYTIHTGFMAGAKLSNMSELVPIWFVPARHFVHRATRANRDELVPEWKSWRYHVNTPQ